MAWPSDVDTLEAIWAIEAVLLVVGACAFPTMDRKERPLKYWLMVGCCALVIRNCPLQDLGMAQQQTEALGLLVVLIYSEIVRAIVTNRRAHAIARAIVRISPGRKT